MPTMPITMREPGLDAEDVGQRRARAVPQAVSDHQRHHGTRDQRQRDAGGDEGEIDLQGHGGLAGGRGGAALCTIGRAAKRHPPPLSPCGCQTGEGGRDAEASRTGEGFVSTDRDPSSGASRHLLPQGEKGRKPPHPPPSAAVIQCVMSREARNASAARWTAGASALPCATATSRSQRCEIAMPTAGVVRAVGHAEIVGPRPAGHVGNADDAARRPRHEVWRDHVEIGDAVDLVVVGNPGIAVAEADLRPHVEFDALAARLGPAAERAPRRPGVARERPGDLLPIGIARAAALRAHLLIRRHARQGAERQRRDQDGDQAAHAAIPYGSPAALRASPVSSRMCRPVLARSTM